MTDTYQPTPIAIRRLSIGRLHMPRLGITNAFENFIVVLGDAYGSVCASPFTFHRSHPPTYSSEELDGRDPAW